MLYHSTPRIPTYLFGEMGIKKPRKKIQDGRYQRRYKQTGSEQTYVSCFNFLGFFDITFNTNDLVFLGFYAVLPTKNLSS